MGMGQDGVHETLATGAAASPRQAHRLKRAMLRAVVDENLATIEGRGPSAPARPLHRSWLWWTPVTLLALLALVETLGSTTTRPLGTGRDGGGRTPAEMTTTAEPNDPRRLHAAPQAVQPSTFQLSI